MWDAALIARVRDRKLNEILIFASLAKIDTSKIDDYIDIIVSLGDDIDACDILLETDGDAEITLEPIASPDYLSRLSPGERADEDAFNSMKSVPEDDGISEMEYLKGVISEAVDAIIYDAKIQGVRGSDDIEWEMEGLRDAFLNVLGELNEANDRISASQYMYAVTFVNKDVYAKNVQIGFTVPTGWYATVMDADGTLVAEAGAEVTIYGLQTVTYYVALMQMGADPDEDGKVASSPVQGITVTISGDASSTKALEPQEISVTVDDSGVSGGDAIDERSGIPSGVWFLVAVIILMIIAAFWLASKRGVFARR